MMRAMRPLAAAWFVFFQLGVALGAISFEPRSAVVGVGEAPQEILVANWLADRNDDLLFVDEAPMQAVLVAADPSQASGFGEAHLTQVGRRSGQLTAGDFNRDGIPDFAVADRAGSVWVRAIAPVLPFLIYFEVGAEVSGVAALDWTGDGVVDLVVADASAGHLSVLVNNGGPPPRLTRGDTIPVAAAPARLLAADLDGDGGGELVVMHLGPAGGGSVSVLRPRGDSMPDVLARFDLAADPSTAQLGDLDGDGVPDLIAISSIGDTCGEASELVVLRSAGDGTFGEPTSFAITCPFFPLGMACPARAFVVADWDGNGFDDVAVALVDPRRDRSSDALYVFVSNGVTLLSGPVLLAPPGIRSMAAGSFTGDDRVDLVVAVAGKDPAIVLFENTSGPGLLPNGALCSDNAPCLSGVCAEGVCCAEVCGPSETCALLRREGTCQRILESPLTCLEDVECFDIPNPGDPGYCVDGVCCDRRCTVGRCDLPGLGGTCTSGDDLGAECCTDEACGSGFCRDGHCCESDCGSGSCGNLLGRCHPRVDSGERCESDGQCESGICDSVDHVCCNDLCLINESCDFPGNHGICVGNGFVCPGDCSGDARVTVDELVRGVRIAMGDLAVGSCPSLDRNLDEVVSVSELVVAVGVALDGCVAG